MTDPLGFAVVGCGMIARFHARAIAEIPGTRVAALVSRTPANAEKLLAGNPARPPCPVFADVADALEAPGVDAVIITTPERRPPRTGRRRGRGRQARRRREAAGDHRRSAATASSRRATGPASSSAPSSRRASPTPTPALKAAVEAGRFGRLTLGETTCKWWRTQSYYDEGGWKGTQALDGGGALMNQAIHNVDLLLWMMGAGHARHRLHRHAGPRAHRGRGHGRRVLRFTSGALGVIQATTSVHPGYPKTIAVHGDRGSARDRAGGRAALGLHPGGRRATGR